MGRVPPPCIDPLSSLPPNLSFVLALPPSVMTLGLGNMRRLMTPLGNPEKKFESILVAGTNGKGSVAAMAAEILRARGMRVGLYTSPHIYSVRERIRVDGSPASIEAMEEAASRIAPLFESIRYSYFEALTAIAFQIFAGAGVEMAVLEVGLGGRFDATNIVEPRVSVLTSISLDHRRLLGDTEEEILREKLGIMRPKVPFVCGRLPSALRAIAEEKAGREGVPFHGFETLGSVGLRSMSFDEMKLRLRTAERDYGDLSVPYVGGRQMENVLIAARTCELAAGPIGRLLGRAMGSAPLRGRFECVEIGGKRLVFDVAHNDAALMETARTLTTLSPREENGMILAVMRRKELRDFPAEIPKRFRRVHLVGLGDPEAYSPAELLGAIGIDTLRARLPAVPKIQGKAKRSPAASRRGRPVGMEMCVETSSALEDARERFWGRVLSSEHPVQVFLVTGSHRTVEKVGCSLRAAGLW